MKDLNKIGRQCIANLNAIGIYPNEISEFKVNSRAKRIFGQASLTNGKYTIEINAILLREECPEYGLLDTLYHELLHCVNGCMNHGKKWQDLADLVNDCYNMNISRTSTLEETYGNYASVIIAERKEELKVFRCQCDRCGRIYSKKGYRAPKWYAHPNKFYCTPCNRSGHYGKLVAI